MKLWQDQTLVTAIKGVLEDYSHLEYDEAKSKIFSTGTTDVLSVKVTDLSAQEEAPDFSELDFLEFVNKMIDLEIQQNQRDASIFEICERLEKATSTWGRFDVHTVATPEGKYFNIVESNKKFIVPCDGILHLNPVPIHEGGGSTWDIFCKICGKKFPTMHCYYLAYDPYDTADLEICGSCHMEEEEQGRNALDADAARAYREEYGEPVPLDWSDVYDE